MKLSTNNYTAILFVQILLIFIDLSINTFIGYFKRYTVYQLIIYVVQDMCLILALTVMLMTFFSTYVFQVGFIEILYDRFRATVIVCMTYIILTAVYQIWSLSIRWKNPLEYNWPTGLHILYTGQRITSAVYYYSYKRSALRISDPRFFENFDEVHGQSLN